MEYDSSLCLVPRPALHARLDQVTTGPITVLAASAGSGKTMLVRSWLQTAGAPRAAWVSVERGERDGQRFWMAVIGALRAALPDDDVVQAYEPGPEHNGTAVVQRLSEQLGRLREHLVLILDDVHELADAEIVQEVGTFLERLPAPFHVVLLSRRELQLGLHRRRLEGAVTELHGDDLRFTVEESRQLLAARGITLSGAGLLALHERTEGWIAGLQLAAISLAGHPDPEGFVADFSGSERTVAEYLVAEVLAGQSPESRRLLLRASVLDRVNGELGDLLTGATASERRLQELADSGAFVLALDPQRTWFRLHHLFADLLALHLRHEEPELVPELHLRSARWFARHDQPIDAVFHAQAGGRLDLAAELLFSHYFSLTLDGRRASARALLDVFSQDSADSRAEIALVLANEEIADGSLQDAAAYVALAERGSSRIAGALRARFDIALLITRLTLSRTLGDFASVLADVAVDAFLTPTASSDIAVNNDLQTLMLINRGMVEVWSGSVASGVRHLAEGGDLARRSARPYLQLQAEVGVAGAACWTSFVRAGDLARQAVESAEQRGWGEDRVVGVAVLTCAASHAHAGRLDDAERWLARADAVVRAELEPAVGVWLQLTHAVVDIARGRHSVALDGLREADRLAAQLVGTSSLAEELRMVTLYARVGAGRLADVRAAIPEGSGTEGDNPDLLEARVALAVAADEPAGALRLLAADSHADTDDRPPMAVIRLSLLQAVAHSAQHDSAAAAQALERALEVAEPDALILPFMIVPVPDLLARHPRHTSQHAAFVQEILDALSGRSSGVTMAPPLQSPDALSGAELRLLRYLPTNMTASAIGSALYISPNTVRTHMRHVYAKLGAHSREQAVGRARALGLLGQSARRI